MAGLAKPQAEVVTALRQLIKQAAPKATESIKWAQPVYEDNGPFAFIQAHRQHVTFGFWRGAQMSDPRGILEGDGERMRHVKLASVADIRKTELQRMVREAVTMNQTLGDPTRRAKK